MAHELASLVEQRFRLNELDRDPSSVVAILADGQIVWANKGWFAFARANGGDDTPCIQVGANYLAAIIGGEVRSAFEEIVAACLSTRQPIVQTYECSSATTFRMYQLRMLPLGAGLLVVHTPIEERPQTRAPELPDEEIFRDRHGLISQCCNCRRTRHPVLLSWHWIPAWVSKVPGLVTHGICPACRGYLYPWNYRKA